MNTLNTYKPPPKIVSKSSGSLINWITQYESLVVFGGFAVVILMVIIITAIFQAGPVVRENVLYNAIGALFMSFLFIYIIFAFMGSQIIILGKPIDVGMIIYISIVLFVIFVFGN